MPNKKHCASALPMIERMGSGASGQGENGSMPRVVSGEQERAGYFRADPSESRIQGHKRKVHLGAAGDHPGDYAPALLVQHGYQIQKALLRVDVGDGGNPGLIGMLN